MRLRRYIAILLISFANIFILAHAVVPHYHHDGIVCFDSEKESGCKACHIYGEGEECCHDCETAMHHGHLDTCDLSQIVERSGDPSDDFTAIDVDFTFLVCFCSLNCYNLMAIDEIVTKKYERYKPYLDTYNSPYVGSTFGLRAPPSSIIS